SWEGARGGSAGGAAHPGGTRFLEAPEGADPRPPATPAAAHGGAAPPRRPRPSRAGAGSAVGGSGKGRRGTVPHLERVDVDRAPFARLPPGGPATALPGGLRARLVGSGG